MIMFDKVSKKQMFQKGLERWRSKYADEIKHNSSEEIDKIFAREKDDEPMVRHPENTAPTS
ncbi:MAG: hypothetical protein MJ176_02645 [Treponema sp.]|nr:hypothetical protein [Treponema sp.]